MTPIHHWHRLHRWPRRRLWPLKAAALVAVVSLVLYPKVWLLPSWLRRLADLNVVVDATHPGLAELEAAVLAEAGEKPGLAEVIGPVEKVVIARVPYAYDWETWGVMDYLPTVEEALHKGREDCDGRAVVAASLLRRMGYEAWLATDLQHMWVVARDTSGVEPIELEVMSPGSGEKTLAGDAGGPGTRMSISPGVLVNLGRAVSFGAAVFPLGREIVILAALALITMQPRSSPRRRVAGCALLVVALALLRAAGPSAGALAARPLLTWLGLLLAGSGWLLLAIRSRQGGRDQHASTALVAPASRR